MGVYDRGETLSPDVAASSKKYIDTAQKGYQADMAQVRKQALKEMEQEATSRGVQNSGVAQLGQATARQGFANEDARFRQGLGLSAADLGERNRSTMQKRGWQLDDRQAEWDREDYLGAEAQKAADQEAQGGMWGNILGTAGGIVGSIYGGPAGGAIGSSLGGSLGGMIGGGGGGSKGSQRHSQVQRSSRPAAPTLSGVNATGNTVDMSGSGWGY